MKKIITQSNGITPWLITFYDGSPLLTDHEKSGHITFYWPRHEIGKIFAFWMFSIFEHYYDHLIFVSNGFFVVTSKLHGLTTKPNLMIEEIINITQVVVILVNCEPWKSPFRL